MQMGQKEIEQALETLGSLLESRGLEYELVSVGGSSLLLIGLISRSTKDIDILAVVREGVYTSANPLPPDLVGAIKDVGALHGLSNEWMNPGPTSLLDHGLPEGFQSRLITRCYGTLTLHLAGRHDQIHFKFYAAVDQGPRSKHLDDLKKLEPTREELLGAASWARSHDPSEGFREMSR